MAFSERRAFAVVMVVLVTSALFASAKKLPSVRKGRRKLSQPFEWTTTRNAKVMVVPSIPYDIYHATRSISGLPSQSQLEAAFRMINNFYIENSGGKQSFEFIVTPRVSTNVYGQQKGKNCCVAGLCESPDDTKLMKEVKGKAKQIGYDWENYERIVLLSPRCNQMNYEGMAYVNSKEIWMNGLPDKKRSLDYFASTLAHELGHTNGVEHAEFLETEYGNTYSVMGESWIPEGHFTIGTKVAFKWLSKAQYAILGRPGKSLLRPRSRMCRTQP